MITARQPEAARAEATLASRRNVMRRQSNVLAATALATAITAVTVSDCRPIPPSIRRSKFGRATR